MQHPCRSVSHTPLPELLLQHLVTLVTRLRRSTSECYSGESGWLPKWGRAQRTILPDSGRGFARTRLPHCSLCGFLVVSQRPFPPGKGTCLHSTSAAAAVLGCRSPSMSTHRGTAEGRVTVSLSHQLLVKLHLEKAFTKTHYC